MNRKPTKKEQDSKWSLVLFAFSLTDVAFV